MNNTGGLNMTSLSAVTVENCTFKNNKNYAITGDNGTLSVAESMFEYNQNGLSLNDVKTDITNSTIKNSGQYGLNSSSSTLSLEDVDITDSGYYGLNGSASNITIENVTITGSTRHGAYVTNNSSGTIVNSIVKNNLYSGIYLSDSDFSISHSLVSDNSQNGIHTVSGCNPVITNSVIRKNGYNGLRLADCPTISVKNCWINKNGIAHSTGNGCSGIYLESTSQTPILRNCTIYDNWTYGVQANQYGPDPNIRNCIVYGNNSNDFFRTSGGSSFSKIRYSCLQTNHAGIGNFVDDPMLMTGIDANNLHLENESPCINAGDPCGIYADETDIDGETRNNGIADCGADESYWSNADYDLSSMVNFGDFTAFANAWLSESETISLDDDNDVDIYDLALFSKDWLWQNQTGSGWMMSMMMGGGEGMEMIAMAESESMAIERYCQ